MIIHLARHCKLPYTQRVSKKGPTTCVTATSDVAQAALQVLHVEYRQEKHQLLGKHCNTIPVVSTTALALYVSPYLDTKRPCNGLVLVPVYFEKHDVIIVLTYGAKLHIPRQPFCERSVLRSFAKPVESVQPRSLSRVTCKNHMQGSHLGEQSSAGCTPLRVEVDYHQLVTGVCLKTTDQHCQ